MTRLISHAPFPSGMVRFLLFMEYPIQEIVGFVVLFLNAILPQIYMSMPTPLTHIQHLYLRAGFGIHPLRAQQQRSRSIPQLVDQLLQESRQVNELDIIKDPLKGKDENKELSNFKIGLLFLRGRKDLKKLNLSWLRQMASSKAQLREKMTFFWHNHFSTHMPLGIISQSQNNTLRRHALGKFGDMLHAIAKDPAMILYLNNHQNKKGHPNENFAREVMELFTLGEGKYSEQDIKEAARAFTGWTTTKGGRFRFEKEQHDFGHKVFMGREGNFNGEDILNILLSRKDTAVHLCRKIYREFVADQVDEQRIQELANHFYDSDYDIAQLMRRIFTSNWFYSATHFGAKIKSPIELIVGYMRLLDMRFKKERLLLLGQKALGQVLFAPPNVAGWPGGTHWIDSSSLLFRMKLPLVIFAAHDYDLSIKPDFEDAAMDQPMSKSQQKKLKKAEAQVNWKPFVNAFRHVWKEEALLETLLDTLIQSPKDRIDRDLLRSYADSSSRENLIKSLSIRIMALPEYQLC